MHYDYQSSARVGATPGKHVSFWVTESRLPITDPIWGYVQHSAKAWGTDRNYDFDFERYEDNAARLLAMAKDYMERDTFEFYALEIIRQTLHQHAWEVNKFGSTPGGYAYMETAYKRFEQVDGKYRDQTFYIALGLTENYNPDGSSKEGTRWYVDFKTEGGDVLEYVYLEWDEVTPARLAGWVRHFISNIPLYPFQPDFMMEDMA